MSVISVTPEPDQSRVRIDIDAPGHSHATVMRATVTPEPYPWDYVYGLTELHHGAVTVYDWAAPLNTELSYKALPYTREGDRLRAGEDYTETVTTTLEPAP